MYLPVKSVEPLEGYKLLIIFANNEKRIFDVSHYMSLGKFAELENISLFNTVAVKFDSIEWANHLDIDPEFLYDKSIRMEDDNITGSSGRRS